MYTLKYRHRSLYARSVNTCIDIYSTFWYKLSVASLQKSRVGKHTYWRIVESKRVNGKPRPVPILHLGTADQLFRRLTEGSEGICRLKSFQHGDIAALKTIADRLKVVDIIDRHVPQSSRALSVGTTLLLAAINRAVRPRSKRAWAGWAKDTSIPHLFQVKPKELTSQYFWDQMNEVSEATLIAIENELTQRIVQEFGLKLNTVFYDTTNFFTYIASTNKKPTLAQRGHSKQKRSDLRLFSLALLVCLDGGVQVPLCSQVYPGNVVDSKQFPHSLTSVRKRLESLVGCLDSITIVYDKGNNSKVNQATVDNSELHYIAGLPASQYKDLAGIPHSEYQPLESGKLKGLRVHRLERELWGKKRTIVLYISDKLREGQIRGLNQQLAKRLRSLHEWQIRLEKPRSGPKSKEKRGQKVREARSGQYFQGVLNVEFNARRRGGNRLSWTIDEAALKDLHDNVFGKRILMTDQADWSTEEIILGYRGQGQVERVFRQGKDPEHLAVRPQYHWTDQKIRVHTFICLMAMLLSRLVEREAKQCCGWVGDLSDLLDQLGSVRRTLIVRSDGHRGRPRCQWMLEEMTDEVRRLYFEIVPSDRSLVYTPNSASNPGHN